MTSTSELFGVGPYSSVSGKTVIHLGVQIEAGSPVSRFIVTVAGPVTRAADHLTLTSLSGTYSLALAYDSGTVVTLTNQSISPGTEAFLSERRLHAITATPS